jgi:dTDP-4-dehydrorhamnose 3,5-epimerase
VKTVRTPLEGVLVLEPRCFQDERGFFIESYQSTRYRDAGIMDLFVQDNHSRSMRGVLRGLHFQVKKPQSQLVTVMRGKIYDVVVDLRRTSSTFGLWYGIELSDNGLRQVYMPPGFAHGFCVLSEVADLHYKVSREYDASDEGGLLWNDPDLGIHWPNLVPNISSRDASFPRLRDVAVTQLPEDPLSHSGDIR